MKPISPSTVLATTSDASPDQTSASAETRLTLSGMSAVLLLDARPLLFDVGDAADVEERLLGDVVEVTLDDGVERLDGLLDRDRRTLDTGELLRHVGVLREELLDAARAGDDDLVFFGQLVDTEDRDDLLQLLVLLQNLLHGGGHTVVVVADVAGVQDAARRGERVDGRVEALRRDLTRQLGGGIEVRERGRRRRVGVVVGGD